MKNNHFDWQSINKKLRPAVGTFVIVLINNKNATIAKWVGDCFCEDELLVEDVTHWANLPSLPPPIKIKNHIYGKPIYQYFKRTKYRF